MRRFLALWLVTLVALAGCGSSDSGSESTDTTTTATTESATSDSVPATEAEATITIENFAYGDPLTVAPGATVKVVNRDPARHDVDALNGEFETDLLGQGEDLTFTAPTEPGEYKFTCSVHPQMRGTLIVAAS